jgi:hypothetical protein
MKDHRSIIYNQGWAACYAGDDNNPYILGCSDYTHWNDGWFDAKMNIELTSPKGIGAALIKNFQYNKEN